MYKYAAQDTKHKLQAHANRQMVNDLALKGTAAQDSVLFATLKAVKKGCQASSLITHSKSVSRAKKTPQGGGAGIKPQLWSLKQTGARENALKFHVAFLRIETRERAKGVCKTGGREKNQGLGEKVRKKLFTLAVFFLHIYTYTHLTLTTWLLHHKRRQSIINHLDRREAYRQTTKLPDP